MASFSMRAPPKSSSLHGLWNVPSNAPGRVASLMSRNSRTQSVKTLSRQRTQALRCVESNSAARSGVDTCGSVMAASAWNRRRHRSQKQVSGMFGSACSQLAWLWW